MDLAIAAPVKAGSDDWLERRLSRIGASEAAAALGLDPHCSPLELWARKRGKIDPPSVTLPMRIGLLSEPILSQLYTEETGRQIDACQVYLERDLTDLPLAATIDAIDDEGIIVEFKTVGEYTGRTIGPVGSGELPEPWLIQLHHQMIVLGDDRAHLAVLVGNARFEVHTVEYNGRLADSIKEGLRAFWAHVAADTLPDTTHAPARVMAALWEPTEEQFEASADLADVVGMYDRLGEMEKEAREARERVKRDILEAIKGRVAVLPDGRRVRLTRAQVKEHTVKASTQHRLTILKARDR
jgi:putative phage-type endonuclease